MFFLSFLRAHSSHLWGLRLLVTVTSLFTYMTGNILFLTVYLSSFLGLTWKVLAWLDKSWLDLIPLDLWDLSSPTRIEPLAVATWSPNQWLLLSHSVMSDSLQPQASLSFTTPAGVCSNSCPLNRWCHLTISTREFPEWKHLNKGSFQKALLPLTGN